MFPEWTWLVGLMLGATIGSFLNVVIYRMPRGISLSNPRHSICPKCNHQLHMADLVPLFSWIMLGGKCRYCHAKVPVRYFAVELFTGIVWAAIWYQFFIVNGADWGQGVAYMLASAALVAIIWIDWELYLIPDQINAFLAFVGIAFNVYLYAVDSPAKETWGIPSALAGWLTGVAVLWGIAFLGRVMFRKDAMGHGDIKMARGIGAVLFPAVAVISFGLAVILGAVLGILQILWLRTKSDPKADEVDDEPYEPESIGSLFRCGLGYLLGIDMWGLFYVPLYERWFGENPYAVPEDLETFEAGNTMIPFGPYLALGAIVATMFSQQLVQGVENYLNSAIEPRVRIDRGKTLGTLWHGDRSSQVG